MVDGGADLDDGDQSRPEGGAVSVEPMRCALRRYPPRHVREIRKNNRKRNFQDQHRQGAREAAGGLRFSAGGKIE